MTLRSLLGGGLALLCVLAAGCAGKNAASQWRPAEGPLMTRWAQDVSPDNALPEYPRPQMVRKEWKNLNGPWDYAVTPRDAAAPQAYEGQILVPYPIESALSGVMKRVDEKSRLWYRRTITLPRGWSGQRILLHFGAVDWEASVFVNGKELGIHRGGYDGFSFDITDALKPGRQQELMVAVWDPTEGGQARGKQSRNPRGIFYVPSTGIWQTVWIEPVPPARIADLKMVPDIDAGLLRLKVTGVGADEAYAVEAIASEGGKEVARIGGKLGAELILPIQQAKLWSPQSPFLYDLKVTLRRGNRVVDAVESYFGMRKIALAKDEKGILRLMLNNKFVFQAGPLDQGFWPDGLYTAPTDAALRYDIEITRELGFNMTRKHVKVEPARWYYWCDKLGLLVWQDMPSAGVGRGNTKEKDGTASSPEAAGQFEAELKALVEQHANHPSIVMWVVFNEGWGQYDTLRLTKWVKELDPSRLVNNASGWHDRPVGDVNDMHKYPGPGSPAAEADRAVVLGEFGGLGLAVEGHTWTKSSWGYKGMADAAALTRQYEKLLRGVWALKDEPGLCAAVYTQITDVETECNGLLTYDRAMIKPDAKKVAAANRGQLPPPPVVKVLVPTGQAETINWRYTFEKPANDWFKPAFDASAWKEGPAGFGTNSTPGSTVRTQWRTSDIWIRREFELGQVKPSDLVLLMHHDEDAEVYLNGVLAARVRGFVMEYEEVDLSPEAIKALKAGKNTIAVHCKQTQGGQYIDVGIGQVVPQP